VYRRHFGILIGLSDNLTRYTPTGVPPQGFRCAEKSYKELCIGTSLLEKCSNLTFVIRIHNTHTRWSINDSFTQQELCSVFTCCSLIGQVVVCTYIRTAMYSLIAVCRMLKGIAERCTNRYPVFYRPLDL
jgi:hypothetical protein